MTSLIDEARARSLELLDRASAPLGFVASPTFEHYAQLWTRDAAISSLGALVTGEPDLVDTAIRTMRSLASATTPLGQVAAVIHLDSESWDWGEGGVVDATAWYVILSGAVIAATGDESIARDQWPTVANAMSWLRHQDITGSGLISAAPSTDWMDSSLVRSGRTLNLNGLYHWAALSAAKVAGAIGEQAPVDPSDLAARVNALFWPTEGAGPETLMLLEEPPDEFPHQAMVSAHTEAASRPRRHYVSHVIHSHYDEHCDVLANLTLVCTGVADNEKSEVILDHLEECSVQDPYPSRTWAEPVERGEPTSMFVPGVETHLDSRWRNPPYHYHNGGVWPFVGGFHATALAIQGRPTEASHLLARLARANEQGDWGFHEWLHGVSGEPEGAPDQTWNAGTFLMAEAATRDPTAVRLLFT